MASSKRTALRPGRPRQSLSFDGTVAAAFGATVRSLRLEAGISQEELAHRAQLERSYLSRLERGRNQPSLFALLKIAAGLGLEGSELVSRVQETLAS
jgi:transcriptional regulator with XRE-family HTH domain